MRYFVFAILMFIFGNTSSAQDTTVTANNTATVYFLRQTGYTGSLDGFSVFIDSNFVCKLNNKRYSIHQVIPGSHRFSVRFDGKKEKKEEDPLVIDVEAGKTYYINLVLKTGFFINSILCEEITSNTAKRTLPKLKEDTKCVKED